MAHMFDKGEYSACTL